MVDGPPCPAKVIEHLLQRPRDVSRVVQLPVVEGDLLQFHVHRLEVAVQVGVVDLSNPGGAPVVQQGAVPTTRGELVHVVRQVASGHV